MQATPIVAVTPSSAQLFLGATQQFAVTIQNAANSAVTWQVNGTPGGSAAVGTIALNGLYTAPTTLPNQPTVTITAALQADPTKAGSASVTIQSPSSIQGPLVIVPALSSVTASQGLQLQVTTAGVTNALLRWAIDGVSGGNSSRGTIDSNGVYTPSGASGAHTVTATLTANTAVIGSAQVVVTDYAGTFTWRNDNSRSGQNPKELALAASTVNSSSFGKLFSCPLDGYAYAQPLFVANLSIPGSSGNGKHNVVFVATEKDSVTAFDADASPCAQFWTASLIPPGEEAVPTPNQEITSDDIAPFVGITGTPVIDPVSSTLYVVAKTRAPASASAPASYHQRLFALDLATGARKIQLAGTQIATPDPGSPRFNAVWGNQRAALLLANGTVYVAFASHHDQGDYHGWLLGYDAATLQQTAVFDVTPGGVQGGIWQSGGGPSADGNQNIFVITGNGTFDKDRGGASYGDSFVKLSAAGALPVLDYFTPCNQATLKAQDQDLGSSAPVLLPDGAGPPSHPNVVVGGGKNGVLYLVDRSSLGGYNSASCPDVTPRPLQTMALNGPILSSPLFWNNALYVAAGTGALQMFRMAAGLLGTTAASQSPETLGAQGATPAVSSNGANNGLIWLIDTSGALANPNTAAVLRAFDAADLSKEVYNSAMVAGRDTAGPAVKFTVPTQGNGKVYVGTQTELDVYGLRQ